MPDPRLPVINFNTTLRLDWFSTNSELPAGPKARYTEMVKYQNIYDGDWSTVAYRDDYVVQDNLCALAIDRLTETMMEFPPVFVQNGEPLANETAAFAEEFTPDLNEALRKGIRNFLVHGTAVFQNYELDGAHRVAGIDPFWWYPAPAYAGDALLLPDDSGWKLVLDNGVTTEIVYYAFADKLSYRKDNLPTINLGTLLGSTTGAYNYGERSVTAVARDPVYGEFGRSILLATVPLMIQYNAIRSLERKVYADNAYPAWVFRPKAGRTPDGVITRPVQNRAAEGETPDLYGPDGKPISSSKKNILVGGGYFALPDWAESLEQVSPEMNISDGNDFAEEIRRDLLTQFGLSPTVLGYQYGLERPSGESIREESASTSTVTSYLQKKFIPAIKRCFVLAATASGVDTTGVDVQWLLEMKRDSTETEATEQSVTGEAEGTEPEETDSV